MWQQSSAELDTKRFGQRVKVEVAPEDFKALQVNHGGFNGSMTEVREQNRL